MCHGARFDSDCFRGRAGCVMALGLIVTVSEGRLGCVMVLRLIVTVSGGGLDVAWHWI